MVRAVDLCANHFLVSLLPWRYVSLLPWRYAQNKRIQVHFKVRSTLYLGAKHARCAQACLKIDCLVFPKQTCLSYVSKADLSVLRFSSIFPFLFIKNVFLNGTCC